MHKSQIALRQRWKWHFQASSFSGGACPQTPLAARASGARVPPIYITLATALEQSKYGLISSKFQACRTRVSP